MTEMMPTDEILTEVAQNVAQSDMTEADAVAYLQRHVDATLDIEALRPYLERARA